MKKKLLETASALNQPTETVTLKFSQKRDQLAAMGNQQIAQRPDLTKLVGEDNQQMAEDNNRNFARFMESIYSQNSPMTTLLLRHPRDKEKIIDTVENLHD